MYFIKKGRKKGGGAYGMETAQVPIFSLNYFKF